MKCEKSGGRRDATLHVSAVERQSFARQRREGSRLYNFANHFVTSITTATVPVFQQDCRNTLDDRTVLKIRKVSGGYVFQIKRKEKDKNKAC